jgi:structural maintenance of chromosome 4
LPSIKVFILLISGISVRISNNGPCLCFKNVDNRRVCQASRIAYGAANEFRRVVTLDGELFERSGTMSGGGNKPQGGGMGTSIRESITEDAIKNAESNLNKLVGDLNKLREQMNDAKKRYRSLEEAKSRFEMELAKVKKEVCN